MLKYSISAALIVGSVALSAASPQTAFAAASCAATPPQKTMMVAGTVTQVGNEPLTYQHMIIQDDKTNCRVVVLVEKNDKPCPYLSRASITIPVAPATAKDRATFGKVDYMDKGGEEMFACK